MGVLFIILASVPCNALPQHVTRCDLPFPIYYNDALRPSDRCATAADAIAAIQAAIDTWNAASPGVQLLEYAGPTNVDDLYCDGPSLYDFQNELVWDPSVQFGHTCTHIFPGTFDRECDVEIATFVDCSPTSEDYDFQTLVLHELGHVLGLPHSTCQGSIMISLTLAGVVQHTLGQCDIDAIQARYNDGILASETLDITNLHVQPAFDSGSGTWMATVTFDTDLSAVPTLNYGASSNCSPCTPSNTVTGPNDVTHTLVLPNLSAGQEYCFQLSAESNSVATGCIPTVDGAFATAANIYDVAGQLSVPTCELQVSWKTNRPATNKKLLYKKTTEGTWSTVNAEADQCVSDLEHYAAAAVTPGYTYEYKAQCTIDGVVEESTTYQKKVKLCASSKPVQLSEPSFKAWPDPQELGTRMQFSVPVTSYVEIAAYTVAGRQIARIASASFAPGVHQLTWDGMDVGGNHVSNGIYLLRLTVDGQTLGVAKVPIVR